MKKCVRGMTFSTLTLSQGVYAIVYESSTFGRGGGWAFRCFGCYVKSGFKTEDDAKEGAINYMYGVLVGALDSLDAFENSKSG